MIDSPSQVTLPNTEIHLLQSAYNDQSYKLSIALPNGYHDSEESYPVIYATDANWIFSAFHGLVGRLGIPPVIVVGIGYPTDDHDELQRLRLRDTLTHSPKYEKLAEEAVNFRFKSGGVDKFTAFVCDELFPFISSRYRTKPEDRTFWGYSAGGNLGLFLLFKHTDTFSRYVIGAPGLHWDDQVYFAYENEHAEKATDLPVRLYLCVGSLDESSWEPNASLLVKFHTSLSKRDYPNLNMIFEVFNGEDHSTGGIPSIIYGLRSVFR